MLTHDHAQGRIEIDNKPWRSKKNLQKNRNRMHVLSTWLLRLDSCALDLVASLGKSVQKKENRKCSPPQEKHLKKQGTFPGQLSQTHRHALRQLKCFSIKCVVLQIGFCSICWFEGVAENPWPGNALSGRELSHPAGKRTRRPSTPSLLLIPRLDLFPFPHAPP